MKKSLLLIALNIFILLPFYSQTLSDSLVAHYFLDGNGNDSVGNNHGTIMGATPTIDRNSNSNSAYSFNGTGNWINIGNYPDLAITGDITVSAWVKTPTTWPTVYSDPQIYARYTYSLSNPTGVNLFLDDPHLANTRNFSLILKSGTTSWGNDVASSTSTLQLNTWYFVVGVRDGNITKLYLNGVLEGSDLGSSTPINYGATPTATIGEKNGDSPGFFNGVIDDVRIYKRALSTTEVQTLHTTISSVGYLQGLKNQISVYPNPTSNLLNIKIDNNIKISRIEILNVSGQLVKSKSLTNNELNIQVDISDLKDGTYFIKIFDVENDFTTTKFVKLKE